MFTERNLIFQGEIMRKNENETSGRDPLLFVRGRRSKADIQPARTPQIRENLHRRRTPEEHFKNEIEKKIHTYF
jgi:hypothetical protein